MSSMLASVRDIEYRESIIRKLILMSIREIFWRLPSIYSLRPFLWFACTPDAKKRETIIQTGKMLIRDCQISIKYRIKVIIVTISENNIINHMLFMLYWAIKWIDVCK